MDISYHNNDIILKYMSEAFKDTALTFYGLDTPRIKVVIPTELPVVEVSENAMDFVFLLEDGSYLHLEFQTTVKTDDLQRFMLYDARLYKKDSQRIRTAVIYSGNISKAPEYIDAGSINYKVSNVYMSHYDGNIIYERLKAKVRSKEKLCQKDILDLVFLPLMKTTLNKNEAAINAVKLAEELEDNEQRLFCIGAIIGIADKFIDKDYVNRLKEVLKMNRIVAALIKDEVEEALNAERQEMVRKMLKEGLSIESIAKIIGLSLEEIGKFVTVSNK